MRNLILITALLLCLTTRLAAQKLPGKQDVSLKAPANLVIDGKMNEWGDKLQAYNKSTLIYYTMANDADNLYLVVRIENRDIINKAISGAITLTVNASGKQNDEKCPAISFPLLNPGSGIAIRNNAGLNSKLIQQMMNDTYGTAMSSDLKSKNKTNDSLLLATNKRLNDDAKEIKFSDIVGITDTVTGTHTDKYKQFKLYPLFVVPGYYIKTQNSVGIKAAAGFDGNWKYTYELAVPVKYLKVEPGKKFAYNIRLNGPMYKTHRPTAGAAVHFKIVDGQAVTQDEDLLEATDLWAEYTLAN